MFIQSWLIATWEMISVSSTWLLFGFFISGILHEIFPKNFLKRQLSTPGWKSILKASAFGVPLPLCSCSVIPVGVALRRSGASRGSVTSFFISTPEIGVDSYLLSHALLGPFMAICRIVSAFLSAFGVGLFVDYLLPNKPQNPSSEPIPHSCCNNAQEEQNKDTQLKTLVKILHYSYIEIFDDLAILLSIGFLSAGFIGAILPDQTFQMIGLSPWLSMLLMLLISLPIYVCATSSTPLAAALIAKGLNPGAALVFLLAGPATNISTILVIQKELGKGALIVYLVGTSLVALSIGALVNSLNFPFAEYQHALLFAHSHHSGLTQIFHSITGLTLILLLIFSLFRRSQQKH